MSTRMHASVDWNTPSSATPIADLQALAAYTKRHTLSLEDCFRFYRHGVSRKEIARACAQFELSKLQPIEWQLPVNFAYFYTPPDLFCNGCARKIDGGLACVVCGGEASPVYGPSPLMSLYPYWRAMRSVRT